MRKEDYGIMHALEANYWWFEGMRKITQALLSRYLAAPPESVLDVGCGTGINLLWMMKQFQPRRITGCDFSSIALGWCAETLRTSPAGLPAGAIRLSRGDVRQLPFRDSSFDLATSLDVLDLFPPDGQDEQAMRELYRVVRPGGLVLVREPAYKWLLSSHDTVFETRHRYRCGELGRKMTAAGFAVVGTTYANTLLFPVAAARRLMRKFFGLASERTDTQPWPKSLEWLDAPFRKCLELEAAWLSRGRRLPFGLSAVCVGTRRR